MLLKMTLARNDGDSWHSLRTNKTLDNPCGVVEKGHISGVVDNEVQNAC